MNSVKVQCTCPEDHEDFEHIPKHPVVQRHLVTKFPVTCQSATQVAEGRYC